MTWEHNVAEIIKRATTGGVAEPFEGTTWVYQPVELDPCGECPKGQCDNCDGCLWAASGFTSADALIRRLGGR